MSLNDPRKLIRFGCTPLVPKRYYPAWSGKFVSRRKPPSFDELKGGYLQHLTLRNLARVFIIQGWFRWLCRKGFIPHDPIAGVKPPRRTKHLPKGVLTVDEIKKVMAKPDIRTMIGYRDRTIMEVLYSTGMRSAELVALAVRDLDFEKKTARIRSGKGDRERLVPLSPPCIRFLTRYLEAFRPELAEGVRPAGNSWLKKYRTGGDTLFLSLYGGALTPTWLSQSMKRYIRAAGITRPMSPVHSWRHYADFRIMPSCRSCPSESFLFNSA